MGRYVRGTAGFSFKYHPEQDTNLEQLGAWAGFDPDERSRSLAGQAFVPYDTQGVTVIDAASWGTSVCETALPPWDLSADVESAIYQVSDRWRDVIREIDANVPGPTLVVDIGQLGVRLRRSQWSALAARIGRSADPSDASTIVRARDLAFEDGGDEYLPHLAACALLHAVTRGLDELVMIDRATCRDTNVWSVAEDIAGPYREGDASVAFEERAVRVRLMALQQSKVKALRHATELLRERPTDVSMFRTALGVHLWNNEWNKIESLANALLAHEQSDSMRAELLHYRGDARWSQHGVDAAREDARASSELGMPALQRAIEASERPADEDRDDE